MQANKVGFLEQLDFGFICGAKFFFQFRISIYIIINYFYAKAIMHTAR